MKRIAAHTAVFLVLSAMLLTAGCITPLHSFVTDVDNTQWRLPATVVLPNKDTTTRIDMHIFIRCNDRFTADTLPVTITVITPDSIIFEEQQVVCLPRRHLPASLTLETSAPYRRNILLAHAGNYRILFTPEYPVRGIEAVGIYTTKSE